MNRVVVNSLVALIIICIMLFMVITAWQNYSAGFLCELIVPLLYKEPIMTTTAAIMLLSFVLGGFIGAVYVVKINKDCDYMIDFYKNKINRIAQNSDNDSALIDSLQRKISSLEIALQNALKDKNQ